jgi:hypothetical protein
MFETMAEIEENQLCSRCNAIDLLELFRLSDSRLPVDDTPALVLGTITESWRSSRCPLCQFFLAMIINPDQREPDAEFAVYKKRSVSRCGPAPQSTAAPARATICIKETGEEFDFEGPFVNYSVPPEAPVLLDHEQVNYEVLKSWCERFRHAAQTHSIDELPLLVIDSNTNELVSTDEETEYVALSYVWGVPSEVQKAADAVNAALPSSSRLPDYLPATVKDAITATRKMGLQYLWVDKYCLDQRNTIQFLDQLNRMAGIYRNAVVTIIAAAGVDAEHGLPGVGSRNRVKQPKVQVGDYTLWSSMSDPRALVRDTKWMTRAWTYQEGACSRNWIAFTDEQVFYQRSNTELSHFERGWMSSCEMFPDGGLGPINPQNPIDKMMDILHDSPGGIHQHINRYNSRYLTYQADAVNGILGLIKRCGNGPYPTNHYFGVPILGPLNTHRLVAVRADDRKWTITEAFLVGLCWVMENNNPGQIRTEFPSWSWAGWYGTYAWASLWVTKFGLSDGSDIELNLSVTHKGTRMSWADMMYSQDWTTQDPNLLPRRLYIQAPIMDITCVRVPEDIQGVCCTGSTRQEKFEWAAHFSNDKCEVFIRANLIHEDVVQQLQYEDLFPFKAVALRRLRSELFDCSEFQGYSETRARTHVRFCALLVLESYNGYIKAGVLELTPDNYLVRWKGGQAPEDEQLADKLEQVDLGGSEGQGCIQCRQAMEFLALELHAGELELA